MYRNHHVQQYVWPFSLKCNSLLDKLILMNYEPLHRVVLFFLRMCMKEDNHGPKNLGDTAREIIICVGQGYP